MTDSSIAPIPASWGMEIDGLLHDAQVPGAAIAVISPAGRFMHMYGVKRTGEHDLVTTTTGFHLASVTKGFVATLAARLANEGTLQLDAPIIGLLPELDFQPEWLNGEISLRDCLSNRIGLERGGLADFGLDASFDYVTMAARFSRMRRSGPFRGTYSYCNPAFEMAALAMQRATGRPIASLLRDMVLRPAAMVNSYIGGAANHGCDMASAHIFDQDNSPVVVDDPTEWGRPGAAGLVSCAADMLRWMDLHLGQGELDGQRVQPDALWEELWHPNVALRRPDVQLWMGDGGASGVAYALGWFVSGYHGHRMLSHSGGSIGWRSRIAVLPEQNVGVCVLMNAYGNVGTAIQHRILELCLDLPSRNWKLLLQEDSASRRVEGAVALDVFGGDAAKLQRPEKVSGRYINAECGIALIGDQPGLTISFADGHPWDGVLNHLEGAIFEHVITGPIGTYDGLDSLQPRVRFLLSNDEVIGFDHSTMGTFKR